MKRANALLSCFFVVGFLVIANSCSSFPDARPYSAHFKGGKFSNTEPRGDNTSAQSFLKVLWSEDWGVWPEYIENTVEPSLYQESVDNGQAVLTFINHATFLFETAGARILFDPMFSDKAGYAGKLGIARKRAPAISLEQLPVIDVVLISHNHYDHLDLPALLYLVARDKPVVLVPVGDKNWLLEQGVENVYEFDWWADYAFNSCLQFTFVPTQHSSGRGLFDREASFWGGWLVEAANLNIFHAGDTGYSAHFKEIGERFKVDLALLPIGAWKPEWFLNYVHMNPKQSVQAHKDLNAIKSIGMHFDTFPLSALSYGEAAEELVKQRTLANIPEAQFSAGVVGESIRLPMDSCGGAKNRL